MKKIGILALAAFMLIATGCGCNKKEEVEETKEPETIVNTEENVIKDQEFEGLTMTNTSLVVTDGISSLVTEVSNNTGADYYLNEFKIIVKDADGNEMTTLPGYVGEVIPNGETRTINSSIDIDLSKAASIEYSVDK